MFQRYSRFAIVEEVNQLATITLKVQHRVAQRSCAFSLPPASCFAGSTSICGMPVCSYQSIFQVYIYPFYW